MTALTRYILVQIPGWLFLACLLWWALASDWIEWSTAIGILAAWILKDAALYPLCRPGFETGPAIGPGALIGREAEVVKDLAARGLVRLDGELWTARPGDGKPIRAGQRVRIVGADGLVLIAERLA